MTAEIRIGISGWTHPPLRAAFCPKKLPQHRELSDASAIFRAIEINGTFYGLRMPATLARWADETLDDFVFALKAPRFITHILRLRDPAVPLANFLACAPLPLGRKPAPIL
jgi:uncharacterized protein YecE (DUF72 family)